MGCIAIIAAQIEMDDILQIIITQHLLSNPTDPTSLLTFVRLQAAHRPTWLRYKNDRALWQRLESTLPKWSLPEPLGLRRRVIFSYRFYWFCKWCSAAKNSLH